MRYRDKATIKQVTTHQNKPETNFYVMTDRQKNRMRERFLKEFRTKIPDKIWWDSLDVSEKTEVAHQYSVNKDGKNNLKELMTKFPGNIAYIRVAKLNKIL